MNTLVFSQLEFCSLSFACQRCWHKFLSDKNRLSSIVDASYKLIACSHHLTKPVAFTFILTEQAFCVRFLGKQSWLCGLHVLFCFFPFSYFFFFWEELFLSLSDILFEKKKVLVCAFWKYFDAPHLSWSTNRNLLYLLCFRPHRPTQGNTLTAKLCIVVKIYTICTNKDMYLTSNRSTPICHKSVGVLAVWGLLEMKNWCLPPRCSLLLIITFLSKGNKMTFLNLRKPYLVACLFWGEF